MFINAACKNGNVGFPFHNRKDFIKWMFEERAVSCEIDACLCISSTVSVSNDGRQNVLYLLFLVEALLVTVWYAETSGVENVCNLEAAENALNLSPTGTLRNSWKLSFLLSSTLKSGVWDMFHIHKDPSPSNFPVHKFYLFLILPLDKSLVAGKHQHTF